ncbi:MAG: hypothetical protein KTR15_12585 [Phycisphaeraceae bacterium]|nr:hypothetical protein [Phycisphaeraceae bacterium]
MNTLTRSSRFALLCLLALACTGCISTGETIRVRGEVVGPSGQRVADAVVLASASKRGGTIIQPGEWQGPDATDESREAIVELPGDGTFVASANWSGTLTLSVRGYKIRRVDDLDTEFLVPNQSFFKSQDQVRLEVVKDE